MQEKGLRPLVAFAALQNTGKDGADLRTRLYAAKTLAELAKNDDNRSQIITEGGLVPLIVWARGFGNIEVQQAACEALNRLGVNASLLESKEDVQDSANEDDDGSDTIGIPEMVQLAESDFIEVQLFAAEELANTALNCVAIEEVLDHNGLQPLLKLAESPNETVQAQATRALLNMSSDEDGIKIPMYEALIRQRQAELKKENKGVGRHSRKDPLIHKYEMKISLKLEKIEIYAESLERLHKLVHTSSLYVQRNVAALMANLAIYERIQMRMLMLETSGDGGIFNIMQMLHSSPSLDMKIHAARALYNLSVNDACREKIIDLRGVKICFDLLSHKNVQIKRLVIGTIAHIASAANMRIELAGKSIDGLDRLIDLAQDTHVSIVQEQLARALAMLALNNDNKKKILMKGGSKIIIRWAGSNRIGVQVQAAKALCNLLEDKHGSNSLVRQQIFNEGALQVLFMLAQIGDCQTKLQVIRIMRSLREFKDGEKWDLIFKFFKDGGITPLCHLVTNPPEGDMRLRIKGDAAAELIGILRPESTGNDVDITDLLTKVLPCLAPLIVLQPPPHISEQVESTPEMRRSALSLFHSLVKQKKHSVIVCRLISEDWIGDALLKLLEKANHARLKKKANKPADIDPDFDPLDEEVSRYVRQLVDRCQLEKVNSKFENIGTDLDDQETQDQRLDVAVQKRLEEGKTAAENQEKMESAYEQMQAQLGLVEAEQLHRSGGPNKKKVFKVVVIGDAGVGKTSLIHRYIQQKPPPKVPQPTLGCEYNSKRVERDGVTVLLQLFDIQGLENFRKAAPRAFFANAHGCIVVFDSAAKRAQSFYGAQEWKKTVNEHFLRNGNSSNIPAILIANKSDIPSNDKNPLVRSQSKMERTISEHGFLSWHACSARDGTGLKSANGATTAIDSLIDALLLWDEQGKFGQDEEEGVDLAGGNEANNSSGGCSC